MRPFFTIAISFLIFNTSAQNLGEQNINWVKTIGGYGAQIVNDVAAGPDGSVYVAGCFEDTMRIQTDTGTVVLKAKAEMDFFFSKFSPDGKLLWIHHNGNENRNNCNAILCDNSGNVYITGEMFGSLDFDYGKGVRILKANREGKMAFFVAKYDANGNHIWSKGTDLIGVSPVGEDLALDDQGNIFVVGNFFRFIAVEINKKEVRTPDDQWGTYCVFLLKISPAGEYLWFNHFGKFVEKNSLAIALDHRGNVCVAGRYGDSLTSGVHAKVEFKNDRKDIFLLQYDGNGVKKWEKTIRSGFAPHEKKCFIAIDEYNEIYLTGSLKGPTYIGDEYAGDIKGYGSLFLARIKNDGTFSWIKHVTNVKGYSYGNHILIDNQNVFVSGSMDGEVIMKGTSGNLSASNDNAGGTGFLVKFLKAGIPLELSHIGKAGSEIQFGGGLVRMGDYWLVCGTMKGEFPGQKVAEGTKSLKTQHQDIVMIQIKK